jgi:hypothetical protein
MTRALPIKCNFGRATGPLSSGHGPAKYRDEAARLRKEAAETSHVETKKTMLGIAELYDRLAGTLEKQREGRIAN